MPSGSTHRETRTAPVRGIVLAAVAVLGVVVLFAPYVVVAHPAWCGACHEMQPYVTSWQASAHSGAAPDCSACHAPPGVLGGFAFRLGLYRHAVAKLGGASFEPGRAPRPGVSSCKRSGCHSANRVTSPNADLKIGHRVHVEKAGLPCVRCHPGAAHAGVDRRVLTPPMKTCKPCHEKEMAYCGFCHSRKMRAQETSVAPLVH